MDRKSENVAIVMYTEPRSFPIFNKYKWLE